MMTTLIVSDAVLDFLVAVVEITEEDDLPNGCVDGYSELCETLAVLGK